MPDDAPASPDDRRRTLGLVFLAIAIFAMNLGIHVHMATNVNFLHEIVRASAWQQGYLESIRETCGILSFFVVALLAARSEPRLASAMFVLLGAGLAGYYFIGAVPHVILFSLVWSFGFHVLAPVMGSMQLGLARRGREGFTLGVLRSVGAAGVLAGLGAIYLLRTLADLGMPQMFAIFGTVAGLGALPCLLVPRLRSVRPPRLPLARAFGKRYRLYCGIELLDGMRKQLFILFAPLVLVREHGVRVEKIALLMLASQVICFAVAPLAGRAVDRVGERAVLTAYFVGLAALFLAYAFAGSVRALFVIYVIDHAMQTFRVAVPTYANRIAAEGERTQLLAMGITMNHVGAVSLPLAGGALYAALGPRPPFLIGCAVAVLSLLIARRVPVRPARAD